MSLDTGKSLSKWHWIELLITTDIIEKVHQFALAENNQPHVNHDQEQFVFTRTDGTAVFDPPLNPPLVDDYEDEGAILEDEETILEDEGAIKNNNDDNSEESNTSIQTFEIDNDDEA
jgi:hypothetical protein